MLVVDVEPSLVDLAKGHLEHDGVQVVVEVDGPSAVDSARTLSPEVGLALQSLFNPDMYGGLAAWGGRAFGVNGLYAELIVPLHAIWSAAIPILLTDVLFPERRSVPYVGWRGLAITLYRLHPWSRTGLALRAGANRLFPSSNQLGAAVLLAIVLGVAVLTFAAYVWRPGPRGGRPRGGPEGCCAWKRRRPVV